MNACYKTPDRHEHGCTDAVALTYLCPTLAVCDCCRSAAYEILRMACVVLPELELGRLCCFMDSAAKASLAQCRLHLAAAAEGSCK